MIESELPPEEILHKLQVIEKSISAGTHRTSTGDYLDREIDIDIVAIDREIIDLPNLKVPHPRMEERKFVLEPLHELAPGWRHPVSCLTPVEMLLKLEQ